MSNQGQMTKYARHSEAKPKNLVFNSKILRGVYPEYARGAQDYEFNLLSLGF